jgi:hypothetical protein
MSNWNYLWYVSPGRHLGKNPRDVRRTGAPLLSRLLRQAGGFDPICAPSLRVLCARLQLHRTRTHRRVDRPSCFCGSGPPARLPKSNRRFDSVTCPSCSDIRGCLSAPAAILTFGILGDGWLEAPQLQIRCNTKLVRSHTKGEQDEKAYQRCSFGLRDFDVGNGSGSS